MGSGCFSSSFPGHFFGVFLSLLCHPFHHVASHRPSSQSASTHQPFLHQGFCYELLFGSFSDLLHRLQSLSIPTLVFGFAFCSVKCVEYSCLWAMLQQQHPRHPQGLFLQRVICAAPGSWRSSPLTFSFVLFPALLRCQTPAQGLVHASQEQPAELHSQPRANCFL